MSVKKLVYCSFIALLIIGAGCVSAPKQGQLPLYRISGVSYVPLIALCELKNISWDYDVVTRIFDLAKESHRIKLYVGGKTVFVDGSQRELSAPVQVHQGKVVVPNQFRQQVIDALFKDYSPESAAYLFGSIKKVIIDPGHGGKDPGAIGRSGLHEKEVTLDIAQRLAKILRQHGVQVTLTRSTDRFIPLEQRTAMTENSGADLFISVHANANPSRNLNGFEVYYITPRVSDADRAKAAARTRALSLAQNSLASSSPELKAILWDMIYTYNRGESIHLSGAICNAIRRTVDTRVIGVKSANYCVLRTSCIPAILIEVGFLSNAKEEQLLKVGSYRQKMAESIIQGIHDYAEAFVQDAGHDTAHYTYAQSQGDDNE